MQMNGSRQALPEFSLILGRPQVTNKTWLGWQQLRLVLGRYTRSGHLLFWLRRSVV
jgi:hypothetical protein